LIAASLLIFGISMLPLPFIHGSTGLAFGVLFSNGHFEWWALLAAIALLAIGSGLTRPPLFGLLSNLTPADEQGATLGVAQSAGSLARVLGPPFSGYLFDHHPSWPYVVCGLLALVTGVLAWNKLVVPGVLPTASASAA
jgi:MFS family permease